MRVRALIGRLLVAIALSLAAPRAATAETVADLAALEKRIEALSKADKDAEALPLAEQALALAARLHGQEAPEVAAALLTRGMLYSNIDREAEAEADRRRAWELREKALGPSDPATLEAMLAVAQSLNDQKQTEPALDLLEQALLLAETHGPGHPRVADVLQLFAEIAEAAGRGGEAAPLWQLVLDIREPAAGADENLLVRPLVGLARHSMSARDLPEADRLLTRLVAILERTGPDEAFVTTLDSLASLRGIRKQHAEAEALARRVLEARTKAGGPESLPVAASLADLAGYVKEQKRFAEAGELLQKALAIRERVQGASHADVVTVLLRLGDLLESQQRYAEAAPRFRRALEVRERVLGPDHPEVAAALRKLAMALALSWQPDPALSARALAIVEKHHGSESEETVPVIAEAGFVEFVAGRHDEARKLYERVAAVGEKAWGGADSRAVSGLFFLSQIYRQLDRHEDAEAVLKRMIVIGENSADETPDALNQLLMSRFALSGMYEDAGRYAEAEALMRRGIARARTAPELEQLLGPVLEHNLAVVLRKAGRHAESEALMVPLMPFWERSPFGLDSLSSALLDLADLRIAQGRFRDAEALAQRSVQVQEGLPPGSRRRMPQSLARLAQAYELTGQFEAARPIRERALQQHGEGVGGASDLDLAGHVANLGEHHFLQQQWREAVPHFRRSMATVTRYLDRGVRHPDVGVVGAGGGPARNYLRFAHFAKAAFRLAEADPGSAAALAAELLVAAQWAHGSDAARALAQMAARQAAAAGPLGPLVRERQDLVVEWGKLVEQRTSSFAGAEAGPRLPLEPPPPSEKDLLQRMAAVDGRLAEIGSRLKAEYPDFAALAAATPAALAEIQAVLRPDEALVVFLDTAAVHPTPEETFVWVVTPTAMRWLRSELGTQGLAREVAALRCGLDEAAWVAPADRPGDGEAQRAENGAKRDRADACLAAHGAFPTQRDRYVDLPFDHGRAHRLYRSLLGGAEDLIRGRHLLVVPSGALAQLPFQVLVTAPPPAGGDHRRIAWLARAHAISVLPAVSSLTALRRVARPSRATRPMLGFGNPLLEGPDARFAERAALARSTRTCSSQRTRLATLNRGKGGLGTIALRSGRTDLAHLRAQAPLPESADEVCAVARDLGAAPEDVHLGARATEAAIKALDAAGRLAQYRILHFATHGALAGEISGTREPGLILTPPAAASEADDGYLSGSEIAGLKLDADWVILSACNTAGPAGPGTGTAAERRGEALSGLARVFFYAGARALLVSHWEVRSEAAVKLITSTTGAITRQPGTGRAEALRRAMLTMIDRGAGHEAHPASWAPFVLVGEGG